MKITCGIDEAGRGAFAGPLVAAAVVVTPSTLKLLKQHKLPIKDSKLLKPQTRQRIHKILLKSDAEIAIEIISARRINNRGIALANREAIRNLIKRVEADEYIIDGNLKLGRINGKTRKIKCIIDADATVFETILAGIVAKVERDKLMKQLHKKFPKYLWHKNAGYGTREHQVAIIRHGTCCYHRGIFVTTALKKLS